MAHRKPLGTTCRLDNFHWNGYLLEPPALGDCLVSDAGTAYLIVGVEECRRRDRFNLICERVDAPEPGARIIEFYWHRRERPRREVPA